MERFAHPDVSVALQRSKVAITWPLIRTFSKSRPQISSEVIECQKVKRGQEAGMLGTPFQ